MRSHFILLSCLVLALSACQSDAANARAKALAEQTKKRNTLTKPLSSAEVYKKDPNDPTGKKMILVETVATDIPMEEVSIRTKHLQKLDYAELQKIATTGSAAEATLVIEELKYRLASPKSTINKAQAVNILAALFKDTRPAVLASDDPLRWVNSPETTEPVELRILAAELVQNMTGVTPEGYSFATLRGGELMALKRGYGQIKDDVMAAWCRWWDSHGKTEYAQ